MVDVAGSGIDNQSQGTRGGSDSSLEKNNVYGIEPKVYTGSLTWLRFSKFTP